MITFITEENKKVNIPITDIHLVDKNKDLYIVSTYQGKNYIGHGLGEEDTKELDSFLVHYD